ncbi:MAG: hypothetical protein K2X08_07415 [Chlamydiales bacterium]|nr:hypothetical protein [Chlamydiales bacterium]
MSISAVSNVQQFSAQQKIPDQKDLEVAKKQIQDRADELYVEAKHLKAQDQNQLRSMIGSYVISALATLEYLYQKKDISFFTQRDALTLGMDKLVNHYEQSKEMYSQKKSQARCNTASIQDALQASTFSFSDFDSESTVDADSKEIDNLLQDYMHGVLSNILQTRFGNTTARLYEIGIAVREAAIEEHENPVRDAWLSAAAYLAVSESFTAVLQGRIASYVVTTGLHVMAHGAKRAEPSVKRLEHNREAAECWNRSYLLSGQEGLPFDHAVAMALASLELAQAPSQLLRFAQSKATEFLVSVADSLGITDAMVQEKVSSLVKFVIDHQTEQSNYLLL